MENEVLTGMQSVISALTNSSTGLTAATFFGVVEQLVPFIVTMVPVALGTYFFRRLVRGAGRAKIKI